MSLFGCVSVLVVEFAEGESFTCWWGIRGGIGELWERGEWEGRGVVGQIVEIGRLGG